jgi:hypothetical protein
MENGESEGGAGGQQKIHAKLQHPVNRRAIGTHKLRANLVSPYIMPTKDSVDATFANAKAHPKERDQNSSRADFLEFFNTFSLENETETIASNL